MVPFAIETKDQGRRRLSLGASLWTLPGFHPLGRWLEGHFGAPTYRVALDAGSTCPNRDGTKGFGGWVYCVVEGSGTGALRTGQDLSAQLELGLKRVSRRQQHAGGPHGVIA